MIKQTPSEALSDIRFLTKLTEIESLGQFNERSVFKVAFEYLQEIANVSKSDFEAQRWVLDLTKLASEKFGIDSTLNEENFREIGLFDGVIDAATKPITDPAKKLGDVANNVLTFASLNPNIVIGVAIIVLLLIFNPFKFNIKI